MFPRLAVRRGVTSLNARGSARSELSAPTLQPGRPGVTAGAKGDSRSEG